MTVKNIYSLFTYEIFQNYSPSENFQLKRNEIQFIKTVQGEVKRNDKIKKTKKTLEKTTGEPNYININ